MSHVPGDPVLIETERFLLRSLRSSDATDRYVSWLTDPETTRYLNCRFTEFDREKVRAFIEAHDDADSFLLGIFCREDGRHVGNYEALCHPRHLHSHLGVLLGDPGFRGGRTIQETRAAVLDFLFQEVGMRKVCGECYAKNVAAVFNYQAEGFQVEGILKDHVRCDDGWSDVVRFAMMREDWPK